LRREEVAQLAGISATWYTWLEQRRSIRVSAGVLDNLARVLKLDPIERTQLFQLAAGRSTPEVYLHKYKINPIMRHVLDQMHGFPAFVMGPRWDLLGWNRAAGALFTDYDNVPAAERNFLWLVFTSPAMRSLLVDWPNRARDVLARFRMEYGRHAGDLHFVNLIERLRSVSPEFKQWWPRHDVLPLGPGRLAYNHPAVGQLYLEHVALTMKDNPELTLVMHVPVAEHDSIAKLAQIIRSFETAAGSTAHAEGGSTRIIDTSSSKKILAPGSESAHEYRSPAQDHRRPPAART
jgi:transcriptional regulator with XRE-family HTH domain